MPRTYVDNAYNRSAGRVGMAHGTAVISRSSGGGGGGGSSYSGGGSSYSSSSSRTYVDNSSNRALGRVGMPLGSAVNSKSSSSYSVGSSSSGTYVDNSSNRALGRVGLPLGSAVNSKSSSGGDSHSSRTYSSRTSITTTGRVYVDNAYNQRLGRVGKPLGSAVVSRSSLGGGITNSSSASKTYVDNPFNRRLGRVGKIVGTAPVTSNASSGAAIKCDIQLYRPLERIDAEEHNLNDVMEQIIRLRNELKDSEIDPVLHERQMETAFGIVNRHEAALTKYTNKLKTPDWVRGGQVISFEDLELGEKLGGGGFGDVHVAFWKQNQVAVKKLRVQRVSAAKKEQFQAEVKVFSQLDHPAIIKFFGACITPPNLAIVMEFMAGGSMYDILHVEMRPLSRQQKEQMISDCISALKYLHYEVKIAHRDVKSMNILICDDYNHCKLGDFGLALKEEGRSSASVADHGVVGTLLYSPPEVLKGDRLTLKELMSADVYSMTVVLVEFLTGKEPFKGMNQHQLRKSVLEGQRPSLLGIDDAPLKSWLQQGMAASPTLRPKAKNLLTTWETLKVIGALDRLTIQPSSGGASMAPLPSHLSSMSSTSLSTSRTSTGSSIGRSSRKCSVCLTRPLERAFRCGHVVCEECIPQLRACPQCRGPIDNPIRIYL